MEIQNFINGEMLGPHKIGYLPNRSPMNGQVYSQVADSDAEDVELAVKAAKGAFAGWSSLKISERATYLRKLAQYIEDRQDEFAKWETVDSGKPISLSKSVEIPRAIQNFRFFADLSVDFFGETFTTSEHVTNWTQYSPLGVVTCISPWNLPLYLLTWKIAPALIAGNTVIAKPSELTPMTAFRLGEAANAVGLPRGVLNIVQGLGSKVGASLVSHPEVKAVSFTGSTQTGRTIAVAAAPHFKKVSLEMGGKNANIIFADCDFEKAVSTSIRSSFQNQGQICLCGSRIFVERPIYEKFRDAFLAKTAELKQLSPLDENCQQGAVVSSEHMSKILSYIELAKKGGGRVLLGGERNPMSGEWSEGYYVRPTVIEGLNAGSRVNQEEIFGPVVTIMPFDQESEVIDMANDTRYGLSATLWTQDVTRAQRVASRLETGVVWINSWLVRDLRTPFGGVKESGLGREGGFYGLRFFSEVKNICIDTKRGVT